MAYDKYPYTDLHEMNLDYILKIVRESGGLHLETSGNNIILKNEAGDTISTITAPYALNSASAASATNATHAVNATHAITADSATTASTATNAEHATAADTATLATSATTATTAATATTALSATSADTATTATNATHATAADTATLATNATNATHATAADTATLATDASNAIETVAISGNTVKFTTYSGDDTTITIPYSVKAGADDLGNTIKTTYVADVTENDGTIDFLDATGEVITSLTPVAQSAEYDTYDNEIADYIKAIVTSSTSNYVTITHGTGDADTIVINYSTTALKDSNDNVIKNTYIKDLVLDTTGSDYYLVAYNGDTPAAELFRVKVLASYASTAGTADYVVNGIQNLSESTSVYGVKSIKANKHGGGTTNPDIIEKTIIDFAPYGIDDVVAMSVGDTISYHIEWAEDSIKTAYDNGAKIQIIFHETDYTSADEIEYIDLTSMHYDSNDLFEAYFTIGTGFYKFYNDNSDLYVIEKIAEINDKNLMIMPLIMIDPETDGDTNPRLYTYAVNDEHRYKTADSRFLNENNKKMPRTLAIYQKQYREKTASIWGNSMDCTLLLQNNVNSSFTFANLLNEIDGSTMLFKISESSGIITIKRIS